MSEKELQYQWIHNPDDATQHIRVRGFVRGADRRPSLMGVAFLPPTGSGEFQVKHGYFLCIDRVN